MNHGAPGMCSRCPQGNAVNSLGTAALLHYHHRSLPFDIYIYIHNEPIFNIVRNYYLKKKIKYTRCNQVEKWLNKIQSMMRETIRHNFLESTLSYEEKPREQWLFDYPAQVSLCGTQIWWTTEVNIAFARLEEGYENALKDYQRKQVNMRIYVNIYFGKYYYFKENIKII